MTDKQEQKVTEQQSVELAELQQEQAPELLEQQEQAQEQQERSPEDVLRDAMATNYLSHCTNARVVECQEHGADPRYVGSIDAIATLARQVINAGGEEGLKQQVEALVEGLGLLSINGAPVMPLVMELAIAKYASNGSAMPLLGSLQGVAVQVMMQGVYDACMKGVNEMAQAAQEAKAADPMQPFKKEEEAPKGKPAAKAAPRTGQKKAQK